MAKVISPGLSIWAAGRIGGIEYTRWRGLMIARDSKKGVQPNTTKQINQQNRLITVSQYWSGTLTGEERQAWEEHARHIIVKNRQGMPYHPTGYQNFVTVNLRRLVWAFAISALPLERSAIVPPVVLYANYDPTPGELTIGLTDTNGIPVTFDRQWFYIFGPANSGRKPTEGEWRCYQRWDNSLWVWGGLTTGKYYWFRVRWFQQDGTIGNWHKVQVFTG